jgi:RNA polymerase sigma-70 factor (ECF subfamily)
MTAAAVQKRSSRAKQKLKVLLAEAGIGREGLI